MAYLVEIKYGYRSWTLAFLVILCAEKDTDGTGMHVLLPGNCSVAVRMKNYCSRISWGSNHMIDMGNEDQNNNPVIGGAYEENRGNV